MIRLFNQTGGTPSAWGPPAKNVQPNKAAEIHDDSKMLHHDFSAGQTKNATGDTPAAR